MIKRRALLLLTCAGLVAAPMAVLAAGPATSPVAVVVSPDPGTKIDVSTPPTGSNEELQATVVRLESEVARYRAAETPAAKRAGIFGLLAAGTWLLLTILKRSTGMSARAKRWLPRVAAGGGVAVGLLTYLATGSPLIVALLYGAGPPLATALQELWKGGAPADAGSAA